MKNWTLKECLDVLRAVALIVGIIFVGHEIHLQTKIFKDTHKINSANFVLRINDEVSKDKYKNLMYAINANNGDHKLFKNGFNETLVDDYIGNFETLGNLMMDNVISAEMAYNELGFEMEKAWCNQDVRNYIEHSRKVDKNKSRPNVLYIGFEKLAKYSLDRDKKTCSDMD
jgi:hypothetical protein